MSNELVDIEITIHGVHQLIWPAPNTHGQLSPEDLSALGRLGKIGNDLTANRLPNPFVKININGNIQETEVKNKVPTASFERQFAWQKIPVTRAASDLHSIFAADPDFPQSGSGLGPKGIAAKIFGAFLHPVEENAEQTLVSSDVQDVEIILAVYNSSYFANELIGYYQTTIRSIKSLQSHSLSSVKVPISHPHDPATPRGWITFSVTCVGEGDTLMPGPKDGVTEIKLDDSLNFQSLARELGLLKGAEIQSASNFNLRGVQRGISSRVSRTTVETSKSAVSAAPSVFVVLRHGPSQAVFPLKRNTKNPVWNMSVSLPSHHPSSDDYVTVELWEQLQGTRRVRLGRECLKLDVFVAEDDFSSCRWIYFYRKLSDVKLMVSKPRESRSNTGVMRYLTEFSRELSGARELTEEEEDESVTSSEQASSEFAEGNAQISEPSKPLVLDYVGKLLIAPRLEPRGLIYMEPQPILSGAVSFSDPTEMEYELWVDFYTISVSSESLLEMMAAEGSFLIEVAVAEWKYRQVIGPITDIPFPLKTRVPSTRIHVPPLSQAPPLIIRIMSTQSTGQLLLTCVYPLASIVVSNNQHASPIWSHYSVMANVEEVGSVQVLQTIELHLVGAARSKSAVPMRPPRIPYDLKRYCIALRIIQAANIPSRSGSLPTCQVCIELEGLTVQSSFVKEDPFPEFNLDQVCEIHLPSRLELVIPMCISIKRKRYGDKSETIARLYVPLSHLQKMRLNMPEWVIVPLLSENAATCNPSVLLALQLFQNQDIMSISQTLVPIKHITVPCSLSVVGLRLLPEHNKINPNCYISWGKNDDEWFFRESIPLSHLSTYSFNIFTTITGICNEPLRVELWSQERIYGYGTLSLQTLFEWLPQDQRNIMRIAFSTVYPELEQYGYNINQRQCEEIARAISPYERFGSSSSASTSAESLNEATYDKRNMCYKYNAPIIPKDPGGVHNPLSPSSPATNTPPSSTNESDELRLVTYPLERAFEEDDLPYKVIPIYRTCANTLNLVGYLKLIVTVSPKPILRLSPTTNAIPHDLHENKLNKYLRLNIEKEKFVLRIYVYSITGLIRRHKTSDLTQPPQYSLALCMGDEKWWDPKSFNTTDGDIYLSYDMLCSRDNPNTAYQLNISVMEHSKVNYFSDAQLNSYTNIDLENRLCQKEWNRLYPLTEMRQLYTNGQLSGHIFLSLTMLSLNEAKKYNLVPIIRPKIPDVEIRLAIYDIEITLNKTGDATTNLFVTSFLSNDSTNKQHSETQYRCQNHAQYNWRFVFRSSVSRFIPTIVLQIWSENLVARNELLAETELDIQKYIQDKVKEVQYLKIPVQVNQSNSGGGGGVASAIINAHLSIVDVPSADQNPVGQGRDEPNVDPYLPTVTINRNLIQAIPNIFQSAQNVTQTIKHTTKIITFGIACVFLLFILGTIKSLFRH